VKTTVLLANKNASVVFIQFVFVVSAPQLQPPPPQPPPPPHFSTAPDTSSNWSPCSSVDSWRIDRSSPSGLSLLIFIYRIRSVIFFCFFCSRGLFESTFGFVLCCTDVQIFVLSMPEQLDSPACINAFNRFDLGCEFGFNLINPVSIRGKTCG